MHRITKEQEEFLNEYTWGAWKLNAESGLVDIDGDFICSNKGLSDFLGIEFGDISQNFNCSCNELVSLNGAPQKVGGYFDCSYNKLVSLEGAPQEVSGNFYCSRNPLVSLKGAPQRVDGWFDCSNNKLVSLEGSPQKVGGNFYCSNNQLVSLKGAPREVGKDFDCYGNKLVSLEGAPKEIGRVFCCDPLPIKFFDLDLFTITLFYLDKELIDPKFRVMDISGGLAPEIYLKKMV